jgi:hypothetical protein
MDYNSLKGQSVLPSEEVNELIRPSETVRLGQSFYLIREQRPTIQAHLSWPEDRYILKALAGFLAQLSAPLGSHPCIEL